MGRRGPLWLSAIATGVVAAGLAGPAGGIGGLRGADSVRAGEREGALAAAGAGRRTQPAAPRTTARTRAAWGRKAKRVALRYWLARRPGAACRHASEVQIRFARSLGGDWGQALPDGCRAARESGSRAWIAVTAAPYRAGWRWFCSLVIHEWGHLVGRRHAASERSIMNPTVTARNLRRDACKRRPR